MRAANLGVRFLLELCALAALAVWGWQASDSVAVGALLSVVAPLTAALLWGAFVAPKAARRLPDPWRLLVELVVFGAAVAGLVGAGRPVLAAGLATAYVVNVCLAFLWRQRDS